MRFRSRPADSSVVGGAGGGGSVRLAPAVLWTVGTRHRRHVRRLSTPAVSMAGKCQVCSPMYAWLDSGVGVHCGPHARGPAPRRCPRSRAPQARESGGTDGAWVHDCGTHSGPLTWLQSSRHGPVYCCLNPYKRCGQSRRVCHQDFEKFPHNFNANGPVQFDCASSWRDRFEPDKVTSTSSTTHFQAYTLSHRECGQLHPRMHLAAPHYGRESSVKYGSATAYVGEAVHTSYGTEYSLPRAVRRKSIENLVLGLSVLLKHSFNSRWLISNLPRSIHRQLGGEWCARVRSDSDVVSNPDESEGTLDEVEVQRSNYHVATVALRPSNFPGVPWWFLQFCFTLTFLWRVHEENNYTITHRNDLQSPSLSTTGWAKKNVPTFRSHKSVIH